MLCRSVSDAVRASQSGDRVVLLPGIHPTGTGTDAGILIDKRLMIQGAGDAGREQVTGWMKALSLIQVKRDFTIYLAILQNLITSEHTPAQVLDLVEFRSACFCLHCEMVVNIYKDGTQLLRS
jgi:hypothetical protein